VELWELESPIQEQENHLELDTIVIIQALNIKLDIGHAELG